MFIDFFYLTALPTKYKYCGLYIYYYPLIMSVCDRMSAVSILPRFRITIPKDIRQESGLKVGDKLAFLRKGDEIVIFKVPKKPLKEMAGSMKTKKNIRKILKDLKQEDLGDERRRGG